jgi:hypothetical protein
MAMLFANVQVASSGTMNLNSLNVMSTGNHSFTADGQTFDAHVDNDGTTGWLLVGRGRNNWEFDNDGQGLVDEVNDNLGTPAAFAPKLYSDAIINELITNSGVDLTDVEIRLRRASDVAGTDPYQESRWRPTSQTTWVGNFDNAVPGNLGYDVEFEILSGLGGAHGPVATNTRDNCCGAANNGPQRVFTWEWGGHGNQQGFSYGQTVIGVDNNDPNTFLWEVAVENHALPYTEVFIRSLNAPVIPEPTTLLLAVMGLLMSVVCIRRRRNR